MSADASDYAMEWCNRRVLARIHRLTLAKLRREIEPVSAAALMRFLLRWQRVARGGQLIGADGLLRVVEQLQGFETAAAAWERDVLPARLHAYDPAWLDQACLAGQIVWCRLSPRSRPEDPPTDEEYAQIAAAIDDTATSPPAHCQLDPALQAAIDAGHRAGQAALAATELNPRIRDIVGRLTTANHNLPAHTALLSVADTGDRVTAATAAINATLEAARAAGASRTDCAIAATVTVVGNFGIPPTGVAALVHQAVAPGPGRTQRSAPSRSAPLALMLRRDVTWLRAAAAIGQSERPTLSALATRVRDHLATYGASFLADLVPALELEPDQLEDALWELVGAGLATADGFASLRVLVDRKRGEVRSHFDSLGHSGVRTNAIGTVPPMRKWQEAIRRARTRDRERPSHALRSLPTAAGRWSLLPELARSDTDAPDFPGASGIARGIRGTDAAGTSATADARISAGQAPRGGANEEAKRTPIDAEVCARQLLSRYGVVFRDLLLRESSLPPWRELLVALRRLEARGEIRGGRFVTGFVGEQFALPEALDLLRSVRAPQTTAEVCRVAATDPLNLVGILTSGPRVPAVLGNVVLYLDGQAVASLEAGELVRRAPIPQGASIDDDLTYRPPPRPQPAAWQAALPL